VWDDIVAQHNLAPTAYADVSSWPFGDAVFSWDYDLIADGSKARRLGFQEHIETESMFRAVFDDFRDRGIIPETDEWCFVAALRCDLRVRRRLPLHAGPAGHPSDRLLGPRKPSTLDARRMRIGQHEYALRFRRYG